MTAQPFQPDAGVYETGGGTYWMSSPFEGVWMNFPGQLTYVIHPKLPDGGPFVGPYFFSELWVSADPNPYSNPGSNSAPSSGNITEVSELAGDPTGFQVTNNTCSPYYLWMAVAQEYPARRTREPTPLPTLSTRAPTGGTKPSFGEHGEERAGNRDSRAR